MGAAEGCIDSLVSPAPPALVEWSQLSSEALYTFLTAEGVHRHPSTVAACSSVCKNTLSTRVLWRVAEEAVGQHDLQLSANLLLMLRVFFSVVFAERIPYHFVYMTENLPESPSTAQGRGVALHFQDFERALPMPLSESPDSQARTQGIDSDGAALSLSEAGHKTDAAHCRVKTTECHAGGLEGEAAQFLARLANLYLTLPPPQALSAVLRVKHACLSCLCTMLSSHLFYARRQPATYSDFKVSPAVDILFGLPSAPQLLCRLLQDVVSSYKWLPSTESYVGQVARVLWAQELVDADTVRDETGTAALVVSLLLLNYESGVVNPFPQVDVHSVAESVFTKLLGLLDDPLCLSLFFVLLRDNAAFRLSFMHSPEHDRYLPLLCEVVYGCQLPATSQVYLVMSILLTLSQEAAFVRFLNCEVTLGGVDWLPNYCTSGMSLGSLLLLSVLRVFRDNLAAQDQYLHATAVALLRNIVSESARLHEVTAQCVLNTVVTLWRRSKNSARFEEVELFLDIFTELLRSTYTNSPWLVYMTLREAETFSQIASRGVAAGTAACVSQLISYFMDRVSAEQVLEDVERLAGDFRFPDPAFSVLRGVARFEAARDRAWEQWMVVRVWTAAQRKGLLRADSPLMRLTVF